MMLGHNTRGISVRSAIPRPETHLRTTWKFVKIQLEIAQSEQDVSPRAKQNVPPPIVGDT